jgi:hypothetical protein
MTAAELLGKLDGVRSRGTGKWSARCPAHQDKSPSLSIHEGERGVLVKCFAGCTVTDITGALGLRLADLFFDAPCKPGARPALRPVRVGRVAVAFQFDLAALDLRQRAERVVAAGQSIDLSTLDDAALDTALDLMAHIYIDLERADLFEAVADHVRTKEYHHEQQREQQRRLTGAGGRARECDRPESSTP